MSRPPDPQSYRWQLALLDVGNIAGLFTFAELKAYSLIGLDAVAYVFVPPLIHGLHGHGVRAATSIGLRAGLPAAAGIIGGVLGAVHSSGHRGAFGDEGDGVYDVVAGSLLGFGVGLVTAMVIDDVYLGRGDPTDPAGGPMSLVPGTPGAGFLLTPALEVTPDRVGLGLRGRF